MGQLEKPVLPRHLYRYRGLTSKNLKRELAMIREQSLWCAHYRKLNDPMEGFYDPSTRVENDTNYAATARHILSEKQTIGICCLTDTPDSELMWTHYADQYTGICIGYHPFRLLNGLPDDARLVRLGYGLTPPYIGKADAPYARETAIKILSHKKACWSYEREWRLLAQIGKLTITTNNCVREVLLGSRISSDDKGEILRDLKGLPIRIASMKISKYKHTWETIQSIKDASVAP